MLNPARSVPLPDSAMSLLPPIAQRVKPKEQIYWLTGGRFSRDVSLQPCLAIRFSIFHVSFLAADRHDAGHDTSRTSLSSGCDANFSPGVVCLSLGINELAQNGREPRPRDGRSLTLTICIQKCEVCEWRVPL